MSDICETIDIESPDAPGGFVRLNKSDFNPAIHRPYESQTQAPEGDQKPPEGPKPKGKAEK